MTTAALTKSIDLGAGDDTLIFGVSVTGSTATLSGGAGTDTLSMTVTNADALDAAPQTFYTGFERLTLNNAFGTDNATAESLTLNLANLDFTNFVTTTATVFGAGANAGKDDSLTLSNLANNGTVVLTANGLITVDVADAATGTADVLNAVVSAASSLAAGTLTAAKVETINVASTTTASASHSLTLTAADATAVNVTGNAALTLTMTGSTNVTRKNRGQTIMALG